MTGPVVAPVSTPVASPAPGSFNGSSAALPSASQSSSPASSQLVSFRLADEEYGIEITKVQEIMNARCVQCHAEAPKMMPTAAKGIKLETPEEIKAHAQLIYQQAVQQKAMPLGNVTQITDDERALLGQWFEGGARTAN